MAKTADGLPFREGEPAQVYSNSVGTWVSCHIERVALTDCVLEGYSVPRGGMKVRHEQGTKWIMPQDVLASMRKADGSVPTASALAASPIATAPPPPAPCADDGASRQRGTPAPRYSVAPGEKMCKNGCHRHVQPGLTRGMQGYDTCCKTCAMNPKANKHDDNCEGNRIMRYDVVVPAHSAKEVLRALLGQRQLELQDKARQSWQSSGCSDTMNKEKAEVALHHLLAGMPLGFKPPPHPRPRGISQPLAMHFDRLQNSAGTIGIGEYAALCQSVLRDLNGQWFPEIMRLSADIFVRKNAKPLEEAYQMGEKLGEGSFGIVYRCQHRVSGEQRVCKKINLKEGGQPISEIMSEIDSMAKLDHPNIVKVFEYFQTATYIAQIMEPCHGGELNDRIDRVFRRRMDPFYGEAFVCDVMKQTLRALAFMHAKRFAHKDLKPQNIMMVDKESSSVKLIDFGLAELFTATQTYSANAGGTWLFMAPEIFDNRGSFAVDVWASGVLLYNMITGTFPFMATWPPPAGKDERWWSRETRAKITSPDAFFPPPKPGVVSEDCLALLRLMLTKDARTRPTAEQCLDHCWFARFRPEIPPTLSVGVVQCVEAFTLCDELKKAMFYLSAYQAAPADALKELRELFTYFDVRNRGELSSADLKKTLMECGVKHLHAEMAVHALDFNNDSSVGWSEFGAAALCAKVSGSRPMLETAFFFADWDCDGNLGETDLTKTLGEQWRSQIPRLMAQFNEGRASSTISRDAFHRHMSKRMDTSDGAALNAR